MIKTEFDGSKGVCKINISGNLQTLISESMFILRQIHNAIKEDDKVAGKLFEEAIKDNIGIVFSNPEDIAKAAKENENKNKDDDDDNDDDLEKSIADVVKKIDDQLEALADAIKNALEGDDKEKN